MLIACWSPKGGSGTTVVATALAVLLARGPGALLADLDGDVPAVLGVPEPPKPGLADWLAAGPDVPDDALAHLEAPVRPGLGLLPWGGTRPAVDDHGDGGARLATALAAGPRPVVADCGAAAVGAGLALASAATLSLLVTRPCYLALRRALVAPLRPSGVVLVAEPGRSLERRQVEEVLGAPVRAVVPFDPAVARAVDAGLLRRRLPPPLARAMGVLVS